MSAANQMVKNLLKKKMEKKYGGGKVEMFTKEKKPKQDEGSSPSGSGSQINL